MSHAAQVGVLRERASNGAPARVVMFGSSEASHRYPRTVQVMERLRESGVAVTCALRGEALPSAGRVAAFAGPRSAIRLMRDTCGAWATSARAVLRDRPQLIWVAYPGLLDVVPAMLLAALRPATVVYDAMICVTQTVVEDRGLLRAGGWPHRLLFAAERFLLHRVPLVVTDTPQNRDHLISSFDLAADRVVSLPIAIDENVWRARPLNDPADRLRVAFWGTFVPLQGAPLIADAINLLAQQSAGVEVRIAGDGQDADAFAAALSEPARAITRWDRRLVDERELVDLAAWSDVCLGIFGASDKARHVVPYKLVQALASGRPVITMASPAVAELAREPGVTAVAARDAAALAAAIEELASGAASLSAAASSARQLFESHYSVDAQRQRIRAIVESAGLAACTS